MIHTFIRRFALPIAVALGIITLAAAPALAATTEFIAGNNSNNWSGYAATGGSYTAAGATWTIPTSTPASTSQSGDATWVGIGGMGTSDLIQTGTIALTQNGQTQYQAWYEILPAYSTQIPIAVNPGDSVTASVAKQGSTNVWNISFKDNTTNASYQTTVTYASSLGSADWIQEMATNTNGTYIPLDNFGTATFTNAWTIKNGQIDNLAQSGASPIQMTSALGQALATTASISTDGTGFSVSRTSTPVTSISTAPSQQAQTPFVTITNFPGATTTWVYQVIPATSSSTSTGTSATTLPQQQFHHMMRRSLGQTGVQATAWRAVLMIR